MSLSFLYYLDFRELYRTLVSKKLVTIILFQEFHEKSVTFILFEKFHEILVSNFIIFVSFKTILHNPRFE